MNPSVVECVYGGTFDPFHNGHEAICQHVLAQTESDSTILRVIPCARPALKQQAQASNQHRLEMLRQWRELQPSANRIIVDDIEMCSAGISYTADTLNALAERDQRDVKRVWILGTDAFNTLSQWHQVDTLIAHLNFWVINRAGEIKTDNQLGLKEVTACSDLYTSAPSVFWVDQAIDLPVASSDIRQDINRQSLPVPKVIADYIEKHELYTATASF